jgi:NADH-quinone oxidoreductase subunit H
MIDWIFVHIPPWVFITIIAHLVVLGSVAYLILLERKVASWAQDRIGPNRVGLGFGIIPWLKDKHMMGLGQPLADGLKFILKEDYRPKNADKVLFTLAPAIMISVVIVSIATLPMGGWHQTSRVVNVAGAQEPEVRATQLANEQIPGNAEIVSVERPDDAGNAIVTYKYPFQIANLNIGVLFILAALSLAVYGVVIGGWASNNKYSFLGGLRATANMISYEIPLGLAVLCIVAMFGTLNLSDIVEKQAHYWPGGFIPAWNVFTQPVAFLLFLVCIHAEANRAPFDLAEAEQELVGGYHTEYSSMRFALFFLAEYAGMITTSAVCVALFFGGWHLPWIEWAFPAIRGIDPAHPAVTASLIGCIIRSFVFFGKTLAIIFVFMWVRWSLPRFRFDQVMMLAWRALIPMSLALLLATLTTAYFAGYAPDGLIHGTLALSLLIANIIVLVGTMILSKLIPAAPLTNRRMIVQGSRFLKTPLPAGSTV